MSRSFKTLNAVIFFSWILLIAILIYRDRSGHLLVPHASLAGSISEMTDWYDIYRGTEKIGVARTSRKMVGKEIIISHEREMRAVDGKTAVERLSCLSDLSYSIKSFEYTSHFKNEEGLKITGRTDNESILLFLESPERKKALTIPKTGDFKFPLTFLPALALQKPAEKSVFKVPILDLSRLSIAEVQVILEEIRPVKVGIHVLSLYKFRAGQSIWWTNEKGILMKESTVGGITLFLQDEKIAADHSSRMIMDYSDIPFIKSTISIPDPEKLKHIRVRVEGMELNADLYADSIATLNKNTISISKDDLIKVQYSLPYAGNINAEYLKPDDWVSSDYEPLRRTGQVYAKARSNDPYKLATYLTSYTYTLIRTMPVFALRSSKDILASLHGDHIERTLMFSTYARAGGMPTRLMGGLVLRKGYFYFHTWPEVWLGRWVPADPTLSQFPADVTHIPLRSGSIRDIMDMARGLKNLRVEVLEAR